jgi:hypothetical protein
VVLILRAKIGTSFLIIPELLNYTACAIMISMTSGMVLLKRMRGHAIIIGHS